MRRGACFFSAPASNGWYGDITLARGHGTLLALGLFWMLVATGTWWSIALALLELAIYLWPGWWRVGLVVDAHGVAKRVPPGVGWRLPWHRIKAVRRTSDNAYLDTDDASYGLADLASDWPEVALLCERRLVRQAGGDPDEGLAPVSASDASAWLRAGRDGVLELRREAAALPLVAALVGGGPIVLAGLLISPTSRLATVTALVLGIAIYLSRRASAATVVSAAQADTEGIRLRTGTGWHAVGWSQLISVTVPTSVEPGVLQTDDARYLLPVSLTHRDELLQAVQRAIAARREGAVLPRLADGGVVPDTALSMVVPGASTPDRGLSRTDGER